MSNYSFLSPRERKKHLLIVEGEHEKDELFDLILMCFPEIDIDVDNIIVYGTNIYNLYQDIINEYGIDWKDTDVDLPHLVSTKKGISPTYNKRNFSNILLVFDYERHHSRFDETQIIALQSYFNDIAGNGQLYLNYPMVESYRHFNSIPDLGYEHYSVPASMSTGAPYKNLTQIQYTVIHRIVSFPNSLKRQLRVRFSVTDAVSLAECVEKLLRINDDVNLYQNVQTILSAILSDTNLTTASHYITHMIQERSYTSLNQSYFEYARCILRQIAVHNIQKANKLQYGVYSLSKNEIEAQFHALDWTEIVKVQNNSSRDELTGVIWILNTCILFVPEYNFSLLDIETL